MLKEQRAQTCKVSVEKDLSGHEWTIMDSLTPTPHSEKSWKGKSKSSECTSVPICFHCSFSVHHPKECKGILSAWHDEKIHGNHGKNHTDEIWIKTSPEILGTGHKTGHTLMMGIRMEDLLSIISSLWCVNCVVFTQPFTSFKARDRCHSYTDTHSCQAESTVWTPKQWCLHDTLYAIDIRSLH